MPSDLILPLSLVMGLLTCGLIAKWYLMPILTARTRAQALVPLVLFHAFRYIGLAFLIPGVTAQALDPRFAVPAAYGDLLAAVLALSAALALRRQWRTAMFLTWTFNVEGTLDLLNAVARGLWFTKDGALGATYFIPAVVVPALLVSHFVIFIILSTTERNVAEPSAAPSRDR